MENDIQEDLLENESFVEDDISSYQVDTLEEKLDHVEALLNENISLLEKEENEDIEIVQEDNEKVDTVSGNNVIPDYSQYIYDFLTDSQVKVETVQTEETIFNKSLNDYTVSESMLVIITLLLFVRFMGEFIEKYVFKRR